MSPLAVVLSNLKDKLKMSNKKMSASVEAVRMQQSVDDILLRVPASRTRTEKNISPAVTRVLQLLCE